LGDATPQSREQTIRPVIRSLHRLRSRARTLLVFRHTGALGAAVLASVALLAIIDYFLRLPAGLRMAIWVVGISAIVGGVRRWIWPALRFRPPLAEMALRFERHDEGERTGLRGLLASAVELAGSPGQGGLEIALSGRVVSEAAVRFASAQPERVLAPSSARRSGVHLAGVAAAVALLWLTSPQLASIGARRTLAPWSGAQWPKRTAVADATGVEVHPLGTALPLRAVAGMRSGSEQDIGVSAWYRLGDRPARRALLTVQDRLMRGDALPEGVTPTLYERLIEPASGAPVADANEIPLRYRFETDDDRTPIREVLLVRPPAVVSAEAVVTPPAYTGAPARQIDLGPGTDERAVIGPILAGSRIDLQLRLNKPIPLPDDASDRIAESLGLQDESPETASDGDAWRSSWALTRTVRVPVRLTDEHGLTSAEEAVFRFEAVADEPPTAAITSPARDEDVLANAVIEAIGEGRDAVGLEYVALDWSPGEDGEHARIANTDSDGATDAEAAARLELATLELEPGDEIWLTAVAKDLYRPGGAGAGRPTAAAPVRSAPRRLRVISESELIDQIRRELASVRRTAIGADEEQQELTRAVNDLGATTANRWRQAGVGERLGLLGETLRRQQRRADRNDLGDDALRSLLDDAATALERAREAADDAAGVLNDRAGGDDDGELDDAQQSAFDESQDRLRAALEELIGLLDRGEDGWVMRRSLERLLGEQREIGQRTSEAGRTTEGRAGEELTPGQRSELSQIERAQEDMTRRAEEALDELEQRAEALGESDPAQADAMRQSARRGRESRVTDRMDEAAQRIGQNRMADAQRAQQEAVDALEGMLEDLEEAQTRRDQVLRRVLADLVRSLEALISDQETQIGALARQRTGPARFDALDEPLAQLHRNTLGVVQRAGVDYPELTEVRRLTRDAATAQGGAVGALRAEPVEDARAEELERTGLARLVEARDEAQKREEDAQRREDERRRAELRKVYREALEQQVALRTETEPFAGAELTRRQRRDVRAVGERQDTLRRTLADLRDGSADINDAQSIAFAHDRIETVMSDAAERLRNGNADDLVLSRQHSAVRALQGLVDALGQGQRRDDPFRNAQQGGANNGGQGGQGGQGQQQDQGMFPPAAQLRVLRAIQLEALELTRLLDEGAGDVPIEEITDLQRAVARQAERIAQEMAAPPPGEMPIGR
jgi:hypothetical protein